MRQKLKLLLQPYLIIAIIFIVCYCFFCWMLFMQNHVLDPDEDLISFWLPFTLPWIPILIWLKPRIRLLKFNRNGRRNPDFLYMMVAALGIAIPTIIAMQYLQTATGKLTALGSINEITKDPPTKYYTVKSFFVDKDAASVQYTSDVSGRYNDELNFHIYIACPLYEKAGTANIPAITPEAADHDAAGNDSLNVKSPLIVVDGIVISKSALDNISPDSVAQISVLKGKAATAIFGAQGKNGVLLVTTKSKPVIKDEEVKPAPPAEAPKAWLCRKYEEQVSNNLSAAEKENEEQDFYRESVNAFQTSNVSHFTYLDCIGNNSARRGYSEAIKKSGLHGRDPGVIILEAQHGNFNDRNGDKLQWIFGAFAIALGVWCLMILLPELDDERLQAWSNTSDKLNEPVFKSLNNGFTGFFMPRSGYYITPLLIDLNIIIFLLMVCSGIGFISFNTDDLIKWGANYKPYTMNGEWWRLLSSIFVHGGFMHLLSNMYALLFVGILLESKMERNTYAYCYIISGVTASSVSLWWHTTTVSIGASGAIFGLYGVLLALLLTKAINKDFNKAFFASIIIFVAYNLLVGSVSDTIDNAAHVGGLVSGCIIGFVLSPSIKRKNEYTGDAG